MHARYEEGEFWSFSRVAATAAARHLARMNEDGKRTTGPVVLTAVVGREVREALHAAAPEYGTKIDLIVDRALRATWTSDTPHERAVTHPDERHYPTLSRFARR